MRNLNFLFALTYFKFFSVLIQILLHHENNYVVVAASLHNQSCLEERWLENPTTSNGIIKGTYYTLYYCFRNSRKTQSMIWTWFAIKTCIPFRLVSFHAWLVRKGLSLAIYIWITILKMKEFIILLFAIIICNIIVENWFLKYNIFIIYLFLNLLFLVIFEICNIML